MFDIAKHSFNISDSFLDKYKDKQPDWTGLAYFTYKRTYARQIEEENRTEEWWETCRRVVEGTFSIQKNHCTKNHLPWDERKAQRTSKKMFELMWTFRFLPPGRGLWSMGTKHVEQKGSIALNNCAFRSTQNIDVEFSDPFTFLMDVSMLGTGVGFDTRGAGKLKVQGPIKFSFKDEDLQKLYETYSLNKIMDGKLLIDGTFFKFVIHDTREGWVASLKILLDSYFRGLPLPIFDYTKIRPANKPIKGFGGTSSGPEPLVDMHKDIQLILENKIDQTITSTDIVDIMNLIGRAVVAGNVRRSAELALGKYDDKEFCLLKQDKDKLMSHRWASNNSILAELGMDYRWHAEQAALNGEPGFIWLENARAYGRMKDPADWKDKNVLGFNPCSEQSLEDAELCTLVETFPAKHDSLDEYLETLKIAYLYAKTVTLVPTHIHKTNAVMTKNRRIGLSQSGIIRAFNKHGRNNMRQWCDKGYEFLKGLDVQYSNWLGIPRSIKITTVKPSGSVSLLANEPPGIHYPHSQYYIRRIRVGIHSPLIKAAQDAGYKVELATGQESTTMIVEFPIKEDNFERSKVDATIWEQVSNAVFYQKYWSDNAVSITVTVKKEEKNDIQHVLEYFEDSLKSISFLPLEDHGYVQAPYETISKEKYEEMTKNLKPLNLNDSKNEVIEKYCDGDKCLV